MGFAQPPPGRQLMARRDKPINDCAVREHLLRLETAVACTMLGIDWTPSASGKGALLDQLHARDQVPLPELTAEQLGATPFGEGVRALAAGEPWRCSRGQLPDWCGERWGRDINDEFELGADNVLRPYL
jgi:hypothetical protein